MKLYQLTLTEKEACIVRDALAELKHANRGAEAPTATTAARRRLNMIRALYAQVRDKVAAPN